MNITRLPENVARITKNVTLGLLSANLSVCIYDIATKLLLNLSCQQYAWGVSRAIAFVNADKYLGIMLLFASISLGAYALNFFKESAVFQS
ncbi:MAG: hypothetical protein K1060chlam5_00461 [Candidatus Anoxychlamydiales bacterium]|nr:hypothetical protein [Candidatus Anoxychlamydiales bacterium]